jgi:dTDP-4-dehydrorhamnose reductase
MDKVLIIGISGLLGSRAYETGKNKYEIYGTYNKHEIKNGNFFKLDVTKINDVFKVFEKIKPDLVIDTHSITNVDHCETNKEDAWEINVCGTRNVAEACKTFGSKIIFLSTDYVFDGKKSEYGEKDKINPLNYYAKTKAIAEKILEILDTDYIIARTAVLYGKDGYGKKTFVSWVLENIKAGKEIKIVIDQFSNPTFVDNLAEILFKLYEKDAHGLFHIVGGECLSRYEFALKIAEIFSLNKKLIKQITSPELNQVAIRPRKLNLMTNKLERLIGEKPIGVEEGLKTLKKQLV